MSEVRIKNLTGISTPPGDTSFVTDGTTTNRITYSNLLDSIMGKILTAVLTNDILADAMNVPASQCRFFNMGGDTYTGSLPDSNYKYGKGIVLRRQSFSLTVIVFPESTGVPIINHYYNGTWTDWQDFAGNPMMT